MSIDLTGWNEYIADDMPPGPIPCGVDLEIMQIIISEATKTDPDGVYPGGLVRKPGSFNLKIFWREKQ